MMRRLMAYGLWLMGLLFFLSFLQTGCTAQNQDKMTDKAKIIDPYVWDFGRVKEGEVLKHNFVFKNESKTTLNIKDITTSCSCTVSKVKKKVLAAGETSLIEVKFNTKGYSGPTQQFIYVNTDNLSASPSLSINGEGKRTIDNPVVRFIIKAEVVKRKSQIPISKSQINPNDQNFNNQTKSVSVIR